MILSQRAGQTAFKDLIEADAIDIEKLRQHIQKRSIVAEFKPLCWKLLFGKILFLFYFNANDRSVFYFSGIKSPYRETRTYVDQANCETFRLLQTTLIQCQLVRSNTPINEQFLNMYLLHSHAVKLPLQSTVIKR